MTAMRRVTRALVMAGIGAALLSGVGNARMVEELVEVPVEVKDVKGTVVRHTIRTTVYHDDSRARSPFLILNHGRAVEDAVRRQLRLDAYMPHIRYFVGRGFAVLAPLRVGYGATGGPDVENSGSCAGKVYPPVYEAGAQQSLAVIAFARTRPFIDPNKGLVMGQSMGGTIALALAAKNIPGVLGAINFAGGGGGNPQTRPGQPCRPERLTALFASYGASARTPTLWLYSENDQFMGKAFPRLWFKAFVDSGGVGQFVQLPPYKADGHGSFVGNPAAWRPAVEGFLRPLF
jgi:dienelactone hydrolase